MVCLVSVREWDVQGCSLDFVIWLNEYGSRVSSMSFKLLGNWGTKDLLWFKLRYVNNCQISVVFPWGWNAQLIVSQLVPLMKITENHPLSGLIVDSRCIVFLSVYLFVWDLNRNSLHFYSIISQFLQLRTSLHIYLILNGLLDNSEINRTSSPE